jgi:hypothetical protein
MDGVHELLDGLARVLGGGAGVSRLLVQHALDELHGVLAVEPV